MLPITKVFSKCNSLRFSRRVEILNWNFSKLIPFGIKQYCSFYTTFLGNMNLAANCEHAQKSVAYSEKSRFPPSCTSILSHLVLLRLSSVLWLCAIRIGIPWFFANRRYIMAWAWNTFKWRTSYFFLLFSLANSL